MKKYNQLKLLVMALGVVLLSFLTAEASIDILRVTPVGYRIGEAGEIVTDRVSSVVTILPSDETSIVWSNEVALTLTAKAGFGYRTVGWQKFYIDPTCKSGQVPQWLETEDPESVQIAYSSEASWIYLVAVMAYDDNRTLTLAKSPFGEGTIGTNYGTYACQKGDVFSLLALPKHDDATGYDHATFLGWSDGVKDAQRKITVFSNDTYMANFMPNTWRVTFDPQGGAVVPASKLVTCDATYGRLPTPMRTGYRFVDWLDALEDGKAVKSDTVVGALGDHTLFASWNAMRFAICLSTAGKGNGTVSGEGNYAYGSVAVLEARPYEGSVFTAWADGETKNPRSVTVTGDADYVANFDMATYDVWFTYRDASGNLVTDKSNKGIVYGMRAEPPAEAAVNAWPEHTFVNWSDESYKKVTSDLSGTRAVTAIYDAQTYPVTFVYRNWQGNCVTTMPQNVASGACATPPPTSVTDNWEGHALRGWEPDYSVIRGATVVEAVYETNDYTVSFVYRNAAGEEQVYDDTVPYHGVASLDGVSGLKSQWPGHTFVRWSCNGKTVDEKAGVVVTADMKIVAVYESYARIGFEPNGAEGEMATQVYTNTFGEVSLASNAFTRAGYTFREWITPGTDDVRHYEDGAKITVEDGDEIRLLAQWEPITYTFKFDANGHGTIPPLTQGELPNYYYASHQAVYDQEYTWKDPPQPTITAESDYTLKGWSLASDRVVPDGGYTTSCRNLTTNDGETVTLYAIWEAQTRRLTIDDGSGSSRTIDRTYGAEIQETDLGAPAERAGHAFAGWSTNGVIVTFPLTVTDDLALKAEYAANTYAVRYHAGEGTGSMADQSFTYDEAQALSSAGELEAPGGMVFDVWTNAVADAEGRRTYEDGETVSNLTAAANGFVDLHATWKAGPSYTVSFDGNGETSGSMSEQRIACGKSSALKTNSYLRTGHAFEGWATNAADAAACRVTHENGAKVCDLAAKDGTAALIAVWSPNAFEVAFDGNGATDGEMANQPFTYDVAQALTPNAYARAGYTFSGWTNLSYSSQASYPSYADRAIVSNLTTAAGDIVNLQATWTPIAYAIAFDGNGNDGGTVPPSTNAKYDAQVALPTAVPTLTGFEFKGWTNVLDGVKVYAAGETVSNLTTTANATVTLAATWEKLENPLGRALGIQDIPVSDEDGVWTISETGGIKRQGNVAGGVLNITVDKAGSLYIEFTKGYNGTLVIKLDGEDVSDDEGNTARYTDSDGQPKLTIPRGGNLKFTVSGTPAAEDVWTLKNFKWTPAK